MEEQMTEENKAEKEETTVDQSKLNDVLSAAVNLLDGRNWHELSNKENTLLLKLEAIGMLKARNGFITKTGR
jgi:hypothetical protein